MIKRFNQRQLSSDYEVWKLEDGSIYFIDPKGMVWYPSDSNGILQDFTIESIGSIEYLKGVGLPIRSSLGSLSSVEDKVSQIAEKIPVVGQVVQIVKIAASLIDSIFGSSEDKARMEQAGQINEVNAVLRQQIIQVDQNTVSVRDGLMVLDQALKSVGLSGISNGRLGNYADATLLAAQQSNTQLKAALAAKTENLKALILLFNDTVERTHNLVTGKTTMSRIILWSLAGIALAGVGYIAYTEFSGKRSHPKQEKALKVRA